MAAAVATTPKPSKAQCFRFSAPASCPVDEIIRALEEIVGVGGLLYLQHFGGVRFLAATASMAGASRLVAAGSLQLCNVDVPVEQIGPLVAHVSVFRLPPFVADDALVSALSPYGKVSAISHVTFKDRPDLRTGTRVVRMEMRRPVPNFLVVDGYRVMAEYRGMRRVCSRCDMEGHFAKTCTTPRCSRCAVFGHTTDGCTAPCRRCGHAHATSDCTGPRLFSAVARGTPATTANVAPSALPAPEPVVEKLEQHSDEQARTVTTGSAPVTPESTVDTPTQSTCSAVTPGQRYPEPRLSESSSDSSEESEKPLVIDEGAGSSDEADMSAAPTTCDKPMPNASANPSSPEAVDEASAEMDIERPECKRPPPPPSSNSSESRTAPHEARKKRLCRAGKDT